MKSRDGHSRKDRLDRLHVPGTFKMLDNDKATPGTITIEKNTGFNRKNADQNVLTYRLENELVVQDIHAISAHTVCFERNPYHYPAANLKFVTAVKTRNLLHDKPVQERKLIFDNEFSRETRAIGIRIAAPSLLLREGKRVVNIYFEAENKEWLKTLQKIEPKLVKLVQVKLKVEKLSMEKPRLEFLSSNDQNIETQLKSV